MENYNQSTSVPMTYCCNCGKWFATGTAHTCVVPTYAGSTVVYMSFPFQPNPLEQKVLELMDKIERLADKIDELENRIDRLCGS